MKRIPTRYNDFDDVHAGFSNLDFYHTDLFHAINHLFIIDVVFMVSGLDELNIKTDPLGLKYFQ